MRRLSAAVLAAGLVVAVAVAGAGPASAFGSAQSLAGPNAWVMTELAVSGAQGLVQTPAGTIDETYDTRAITRDPRRAPTAVGKPAGWLSKVPGLGRLGGIVQSGAVILDLAGFSFGGDEWVGGEGAPDVVTGPAVGGSFTGFSGTVTGSGSPAGDVFEVRVSYAVKTKGMLSNLTTGATGRCLDGTYVNNSAGIDPDRDATLRLDLGGCSRGLATVDLWVSEQFGARQVYARAGSYAEGASQPLPAGAPVASTLTSRVECRDATGETTTVEGRGSGVVGRGQTFSPPDARCPDGTVAVSGSVTATAPDGTVTELVPPVAAPAWVGTLPQTAPGCTVAGAVCALDLEVLLPNTADQYVSCGINPRLCVNWQAQPVQTPARFRCTYGGDDVGIDRCRGIEVDPEATPSPLTVPYPLPRPEGAPVIAPSRPSEGVAASPEESVIVSALRRAFVPRQETLTSQTAQLVTMARTRPPTSLMFDVTPALLALPAGFRQGCAIFPDFSPWQDGGLVLPCEPPRSPALTALRLVASLGMVAATAFAVWRMLSASFGGRAGVDS